MLLMNYSVLMVNIPFVVGFQWLLGLGEVAVVFLQMAPNVH